MHQFILAYSTESMSLRDEAISMRLERKHRTTGLNKALRENLALLFLICNTGHGSVITKSQRDQLNEVSKAKFVKLLEKKICDFVCVFWKILSAIDIRIFSEPVIVVFFFPEKDTETVRSCT